MYPAPEQDTLLRTDRLRTELAAFLERVGVPVTAQMRHFLDESPALNRSEHGPYQAYYDAALREAVARRDGALIARHGFTFDSDYGNPSAAAGATSSAGG
jgi:hypothetical protein